MFFIRYRVPRYLPVFIFVLVIHAVSYCQGDPHVLAHLSAPGPTAFELGKYGQVPVGMFTGTPDVRIALYEFKTRNLSVPVSVSYNSNGIKVDELGSNAGLGWSFHAGGVITRIVRDRVDNSRNDYFPEEELYKNGLPTVNTPGAMNFFQNAVRNPAADSESDLFMFNFQGYCGKFVYDNDLSLLLIPRQALKIEVYVEGEKDGFRITTADGVQHLFLDKELSRTRAEGSAVVDDQVFVTSAWYLSRIRHPSGDEVIFEYGSPVYYSYVTSQYQSLFQKPFQRDCQGRDVPASYVVNAPLSYNLSVSGKSLRAIYSNVGQEGKVLITQGTAHPENAAYQLLSGIQVVDQNNSEIERYDFTYLTTPNKRAFLQKIRGKDVNKNYQFDYVNPSGLPFRLSFAQDHWGYYNGKSNAFLFPNIALLDPTAPVEFTGINLGGDKSPDANYAGYGLLKKVTYPTKGYTELTYE